MKKGSKILIFGNENCNLIYNLKIGFNNTGHFTVTTAVCQLDPFFPNNRYDIVLEKPKRKAGYLKSGFPYLFNLIKWKLQRFYFKNFLYSHYDIYVFTWSTFKDDLEDLALLNKKGKTIIFLFVGSEVRWIEAFRQEFPGNPYKGQINEDWIKKIKLLRMAELYSSAVFSVPDQSGLFLRGYFHMFLPLDLTKIKFTPHYRERPLVIHAPSKRDVKGTQFIIQAVEQLQKEEVAFDFELLENIENHRLIKKLEEADILVDQLFLNGPATLSSEAMAAGCAVVTRFNRDYGLTQNAPICYADENCVKESLRKMIADIEYRKELISKGRKFVEDNNSISVVAARLLESVDRNKKGDFDYLPGFFREKFRLPEGMQYTEEIYNLNMRAASKYSNENRHN